MAEATRHESVTQVVEPERFVLTLSRDEAEALAVVTSKVAGSPTDTARGRIDAIQAALRRVGVNWVNLQGRADLRVVSSGSHATPGIKFLPSDDWS
jgi:hypothetical protein